MMRHDDREGTLIPPARRSRIPKPVVFPFATLALWILNIWVALYAIERLVIAGKNGNYEPGFVHFALTSVVYFTIPLSLYLLYRVVRFIRFKILDWGNRPVRR